MQTPMASISLIDMSDDEREIASAVVATMRRAKVRQDGPDFTIEVRGNQGVVSIALTYLKVVAYRLRGR